MKTLKQQLQEANRAVNFTRHIEGHFYDRINQVIVCKACKPEQNIDQIVKQVNCEPVTIIIRRWFEQILRKIQTDWKKTHKKYIEEQQPKELIWTDEAIKLANRNGRRQLVIELLKELEK